MSNVAFCLIISTMFTPILFLAYKHLPREKWQFIASIPSGNAKESRLSGRNVTYYGLFLATGSILGVSVFFFLLASIGQPVGFLLVMISLLMASSLFGAKVIARLVENKKNTFTVAGGASVGLYLMPLVIVVYNHFATAMAGREMIPLMPVMAALAVAYIIGESIGRLACISFGCCYGKPISQLGPLARKIFSHFNTSFDGRTRKIVYASGLGGVKVVPIQAMTSFLYFKCGIVGLYFFLEGDFNTAFGLTAIFAMGWRVFSESLRADFRGSGRLTTYQWMGLVNIAWCVLVIIAAPETVGVFSDIAAGARALWTPEVIVTFQLLWGCFFLYTGLSRVTGAKMFFYVRKENI
ncbi:MAG: prolipoprotein diacylglyceryl transferase [Proteobacteria bacterium]|nr:prolipoprotein diacylglyceryl transferase [Pseudomonadota bacterium]MBU1739209.1 prolipoprotein diacylglyceryl transferase [Pseudomonadota bacterium]